jgi:hypothetical protein
MYTEEESTSTQPQGLIEDVLSTPTLKLPPALAEAHQGKIDGVTFQEFDSGASALKIAVSSSNVPTLTDEIAYFLPKGFAEDIHVDPTTLPSDSANKNNQQQQYAITVANEDGTAALQELRRIAYEQGRSTEGVDAPQTIEDFAGVLSHLLTGCDIVFTRKPDTKAEDPRFKNRLRARSIMSPNTVNNPKALKKFVKLWEVE